ncbi:MAG TPA: hypothetical protein VM243_12935, partial [Phycisphaerae bacterium]|nr:hypothetical protein [Phycisphaerae bacterium]
MAWVSPELTVKDIIRQTATNLREQDVAAGKNPARTLQYYDALSSFLRTIGQMHAWWFLGRSAFLATKDEKPSYSLREQYRAVLTITGSPADADYITINTRTYEFDTDGSISGDVTVTVVASGGASAAVTALVAAVNADDDAECYAYSPDSATVEFYWAGDDGAAKACTDDTDVGSILAFDAATFTAYMPDFSSLTAVGWYQNGPLARVNPDVLAEGHYAESDSSPAG